MTILKIISSIIGLFLTIKIVERYGDRQFKKGHEMGYKIGHEIGKSEGYNDGYRNGLNAKVKDATDELERFWKRAEEQTAKEDLAQTSKTSQSFHSYDFRDNCQQFFEK